MELKNPQKFLIRLKQDLIPLASVSLFLSVTPSVLREPQYTARGLIFCKIGF